MKDSIGCLIFDDDDNDESYQSNVLINSGGYSQRLMYFKVN